MKMRFYANALNYWKQNRCHEWSRVRNLCIAELGKVPQPMRAFHHPARMDLKLIKGIGPQMEKAQTTRAFIHFSKCRGLQQQNYKTFLAFKARNIINADNLITQAKKPAQKKNQTGD